MIRRIAPGVACAAGTAVLCGTEHPAAAGVWTVATLVGMGSGRLVRGVAGLLPPLTRLLLARTARQIALEASRTDGPTDNAVILINALHRFGQSEREQASVSALPEAPSGEGQPGSR